MDDVGGMLDGYWMDVGWMLDIRMDVGWMDFGCGMDVGWMMDVGWKLDLGWMMDG